MSYIQSWKPPFRHKKMPVKIKYEDEMELIEDLNKIKETNQDTKKGKQYQEYLIEDKKRNNKNKTEFIKRLIKEKSARDKKRGFALLKIK